MINRSRARMKEETFRGRFRASWDHLMRGDYERRAAKLIYIARAINIARGLYRGRETLSRTRSREASHLRRLGASILVN